MNTFTHLLTASKYRARTRGQVMVLGCVALLVMALMLMASYSMSNSIYEKIRVQSQADAQAYSVAVVEARAMNITTHFNRAIAAALVAQMSLHSWMTIATADVDMLLTGSEILGLISIAEYAMCDPVVIHCEHGLEADWDAWQFYQAYSDWSDTLKGEESKFNDGVKGLTEMISSLHERQRKILKGAKTEATSSGTVLPALKKTNASRSEYISAFDSLNTQDFACAFEGSDFDGDCAGDRQRNKASQSDRSKVIENTANASRPEFDRLGLQAAFISDNNFAMPSHSVPNDNLTNGTWEHVFTTQAKVGEGYGGSSSNSDEAKDVGAATSAGLATILGYHCIPIMALPFSADTFSDSGGGDHNGVHEGTHNNFKGVNQGSDPCGSDENCFINYRALNDANKDWGMPTTYGGVKQDIRMLKGKGGESAQYAEKNPWDLNDQRKVKIEIVKGDAATIDYTARNSGTAYAVAKGKVYFHQLGNWQVAPNLFDPFWRAKLHFFNKDEFRAVLQKSGDPNGTQINGAGAPVEGEE